MGVNTMIMALPAVLCYLVLSPMISKNSRKAAVAAFLCGFLSVLLSGLFLALALVLTEKNFLELVGIIIIAHLPVMIIEGLITAGCVGFLQKVRPEMLARYPDHMEKEMLENEK